MKSVSVRERCRSTTTIVAMGIGSAATLHASESAEPDFAYQLGATLGVVLVAALGLGLLVLISNHLAPGVGGKLLQGCGCLYLLGGFGAVVAALGMGGGSLVIAAVVFVFGAALVALGFRRARQPATTSTQRSPVATTAPGPTPPVPPGAPAAPMPPVTPPAPEAEPPAQSPVESPWETHWIGFTADSGPLAGQHFRLTAASTVIGRSTSRADLVISDDTVSSTHARIDIDESGRCLLHDLASTNGTEVDGRVVSVAIEIGEGDSVCFGTAELTFVKRPVET